MSDSRRRFLTFVSGFLAGVGATFATFPFLRAFVTPSHIKPPRYGKTVDIFNLKPGEALSISIAGKPLFVLRRTPEQRNSLKEPYAELRDPMSAESKQPAFARNSHRSLTPEIFVAWGLCTHLGCRVSYAPAHNAEFYDTNLQENGGFGCPCHYANYDTAGRVFKNVPAPLNLEVPSYEFVNETTIRITDEGAF